LKLRRLLAPSRAAMALLVIPHLLLVPVALTSSAWGFAAVTLACYIAEPAVRRLAAPGRTRLERLGFGAGIRSVLRETAALVLLAQWAGLAALMAFAAGLAALHVARVAAVSAGSLLASRRNLPMTTRNLDLSTLDIPDAPSALLRNRLADLLGLAGALPVAGAILASLGDTAAPALATPPLATGFVAVIWTLLRSHLHRARHLTDERWVLDVVNGEITKARPQVVLYAAGNGDNVYQVNMWLSTMERLGRPVLVLLRHKTMLAALAETSLPVVCLPRSEDVMNLALPEVQVVCYVSNAGQNMHLLRRRGVRSVFIGHGDSDKEASFNPFSRVYDQIWVAGQAGRDRYLRADVGVENEAIVEVGRPQLSGLCTGIRTSGPRTVLYAPTWEGWVEGGQQSSLVAMGPAIVRSLLARPDIRLIYKPHPLTGTVDPAAAAAHRRVLRLIERANAARPAPAAFSTAIDAELNRLRIRSTGDEAQLSRDSASCDEGRLAALRGLEARWHAVYWAAHEHRHTVVQGARPTLYECFDQADLMISDISSVVADFLVTTKPYIITNVAGLPPAEFRSVYPTGSAGYLLGPDCDALPALLARALPVDGRDELAADRQALRTYLLGPDGPDAMTRFTAALTAVLDDRAMPALQPL
jgi:CDP-glycerol glycerophosphotransferase (TagB/SpsB family)